MLEDFLGKKIYVVNCDICDARKVKEEDLSSYEKIIINADTILVNEHAKSVLSVLDGTVVYADYSFDHGWVVHVQHEGNYLSIYQNNTRLLKKAGDIVHAGEAIALTGEADGAGKPFYFELWNNGHAIDPEDVIVF